MKGVTYLTTDSEITFQYFLAGNGILKTITQIYNGKVYTEKLEQRSGTKNTNAKQNEEQSLKLVSNTST